MMEDYEERGPRSARDVGLLAARGIGRRRPRAEGWLFRNLSLTVDPGARIGLIGPNGSGKTLLLRSLALLDPLDAGELRWRGQVIAPEAIPRFRSRVTYLHQQPACFPGTVEHNLRQPFSLALHRDKAFDKNQTVEFLRQIGRDAEFLAKPSRTLSGGERQLMALLRAFQIDPVLLLLDEPTAALDAETADSVRSLILAWQAEQASKRSYVWVTHRDADVADQFTDRLLTMREGNLVGD